VAQATSAKTPFSCALLENAYGIRADQLLIKSKTSVVKVSQYRDSGTLIGNVRVPLENGEALKGNPQTELSFVFTPEQDTWKLTSVQYD
jgi:hypothetical protein